MMPETNETKEKDIHACQARCNTTSISWLFYSCSRTGMNICGDLEVFGDNFDTDTKHFEVDCEQTDGPKFRELFAQVLQQL